MPGTPNPRPTHQPASAGFSPALANLHRPWLKPTNPGKSPKEDWNPVLRGSATQAGLHHKRVGIPNRQSVNYSTDSPPVRQRFMGQTLARIWRHRPDRLKETRCDRQTAV
jgi:hypothetical protein